MEVPRGEGFLSRDAVTQSVDSAGMVESCYIKALQDQLDFREGRGRLGRGTPQTLEMLVQLRNVFRCLQYQMRLGVKSASLDLQIAKQRVSARTLLTGNITVRLVLGN